MLEHERDVTIILSPPLRAPIRKTIKLVAVFKRPGIISACALVMSYTLKEKRGKWHDTSDIVAATSTCVENYMKKFITVFLYNFSSFVCVTAHKNN